MKTQLFLIICISMIILLTQNRNSYGISIEEAQKSVVKIQAVNEDNGVEKNIILGIGCFISADGLILTSLHVVDESDNLDMINSNFLYILENYHIITYKCDTISAIFQSYYAPYDFAFLETNYKPEYYIDFDSLTKYEYDKFISKGHNNLANPNEPIIFFYPFNCRTEDYKINTITGKVIGYDFCKGYKGEQITKCYKLDFDFVKGMSGSLIYQKSDGNLIPVSIVSHMGFDTTIVAPDTFAYGYLMDSVYVLYHHENVLPIIGPAAK